MSDGLGAILIMGVGIGGYALYRYMKREEERKQLAEGEDAGERERRGGRHGGHHAGYFAGAQGGLMEYWDPSSGHFGYPGDEDYYAGLYPWSHHTGYR